MEVEASGCCGGGVGGVASAASSVAKLKENSHLSIHLPSIFVTNVLYRVQLQTRAGLL